jgi:hypothetical protein
LIALALAIAALPLGGAAEPTPTFHALGPGNMSCGTWAEYRRDGGMPAIAVQDWVAGYLTAYNEWVAPDGNISGGTDNDGLAAWIDNYCQLHPLDNVAQAASALVAALKARK